MYAQMLKNRTAMKERFRDDEMNGLFSAAGAGAVRAAVAYYSSQYQDQSGVTGEEHTA
jgi:hypothetical protein